MIKRIFNYLFLTLLIQVTSYECAGKRHVHLKIHVPDIVKHLIHTKVVFLHVHRPAPKKPKSHHKEYHRENWSSWSNYGHHHDYKNEGGEIKHSEGHEDQSDREPQDHKKHVPPYDRYKDSYSPQYDHENNNLEQNSKNPEHGQYAVHEDVNDVPHNGEAFSYNYEEGYRKGLETESGHVRTDQSSKFHDDHHEEQDEAENDGFKEDFEGKTDAGRYLVDDVEYEGARDKRDGRRRYRTLRKS
ncbi:uncharacterized protein LOC116425074 [Nomia melanderi]|uniref:uncharacterized protein LOC116425074 n=1 Tax=Nomia melanderi TaxID=2448451 RepID=UPI0013041637|nr:histidine-rich glycoprotein-like [Nomia melanderi]